MVDDNFPLWNQMILDPVDAFVERSYSSALRDIVLSRPEEQQVCQAGV